MNCHDCNAPIDRCECSPFGGRVGNPFNAPRPSVADDVFEEVEMLRAELTAERERADRAEHDCNALSLDVQTLKAELVAERKRANKEALIHRDLREELFHSTQRNVQFKNEIVGLVGAIEGAPHGHYCLGDDFLMADGKRHNACDCWKRTALESVNSPLEGK